MLSLMSVSWIIADGRSFVSDRTTMLDGGWSSASTLVLCLHYCVRFPSSALRREGDSHLIGLKQDSCWLKVIQLAMERLPPQTIVLFQDGTLNLHNATKVLAGYWIWLYYRQRSLAANVCCLCSCLLHAERSAEYICLHRRGPYIMAGACRRNYAKF